MHLFVPILLVPAAIGLHCHASDATKVVKLKLEQLHDRIRSWYVEYQAASAQLPFYNRRVLAAKRPDSCFYRGAKGAREFDWRGNHIDEGWRRDPFQDWVLVTADHCYWGQPLNRAYGEHKLPHDAPLPAKLQTELMFVALGWWPFRDRPAPVLEGGGKCVIPQIVEANEYKVVREVEPRLARTCWVIESPSKDKIWLDPQRNLAFLRRELYDSATGALMQRLVYDDHVEVGPGIWIPRRMRNLIFDYRSSSLSQRKRPVLEAQILILDFRLNAQVDDSLFVPKEKPPGAILVDSRGHFRQIVAGVITWTI